MQRYTFFGCKNDFIDKITRLIQLTNGQYGISMCQDKITISSSSSSLVITNYHHAYIKRTMSFLNPISESLQFDMYVESGDKAVFDDLICKIEKIIDSFSSSELSAIMKDMPVLNWLSNKYHTKLSNVCIIWRDHFLEDNIAQLVAFTTAGVRPENILVFDKGDSTLHRDEVFNTFCALGFEVGVLDNNLLNNIDEMQSIQKKIDDFIVNRKEKQIVILDDGAIITKIIKDRCYDNLLGFVELTEMGLRRIKSKEEPLSYPVVNIAKTKLKRELIYPEIAISIFKRVLELMGAQKLRGRRILIMGYGDLGCCLANCFHSHGMSVSVVDPDAFRLILAAEKGYNTFIDPIEAISKFKPFIIVGASGYNSITKEMLNEMCDNTYIVSGATADTKEVDSIIEHIMIERYGKQIKNGDRQITMLGNGRSINLFYSESIPNQANDIFKSGIFLSTVYLIENYLNMENKIYTKELDHFIDKSNIYKIYYNTYFNIM